MILSLRKPTFRLERQIQVLPCNFHLPDKYYVSTILPSISYMWEYKVGGRQPNLRST